MIKEYKKNIVEYLYKEFKDINFIIILNIHKVRAEEIRYFRKLLFENDINIKVFKNKLIKHSMNNLNISILNDNLVGQIALLWHQNINKIIIAAKMIYNTQKNCK